MLSRPASPSFKTAKYSFDASHANYQHLAAGETQTVSVEYTVSDGKGGTASSTLSFTITGTNDGPVAHEDANAITEDAGPTTGNVLANDTDVDTNDTHQVMSVNGQAINEAGSAVAGTYGTLHIDGNGNYIYTLDPAKADALR